jgi:hypothetical protein
VTGGPFGKESPIDGQRRPNQQRGVRRQKTHNVVAGISRNHVPIHDGAVTEASATALTGIGFCRRFVAVCGGRMRATAAAGAACCRVWQAHEGTGQQDRHYGMNCYHMEYQGNISQETDIIF